MPRSWCFIVGRSFLPEGDDPFAAGLGGTEQAVIRLTSALATLGEDVTVAGGAAAPRAFGGVRWVAAPALADVTVAINDAKLLPETCRKPIVWFHNEVQMARELRRGRLPAMLRARPIGVFVGAEQARRASPLLPLRGREIIPLGLSEAALRGTARQSPPAPRALFTSQAYRGLRELLELWRAKIAPVLPAAQFEAYINASDIPEYAAIALHPSAQILPRIANAAVMDRLRETRLLLAPGHASETFCLAAAEAIALGVPVVTLGRGALKERVRNGVDGFICTDWQDLAARTRTLLTDDLLWMRMHRAGLSTPQGRTWYDVARMWMELARLR